MITRSLILAAALSRRFVCVPMGASAADPATKDTAKRLNEQKRRIYHVQVMLRAAAETLVDIADQFEPRSVH